MQPRYRWHISQVGTLSTSRKRTESEKGVKKAPVYEPCRRFSFVPLAPLWNPEKKASRSSAGNRSETLVTRVLKDESRLKRTQIVQVKLLQSLHPRHQMFRCLDLPKEFVRKPFFLRIRNAQKSRALTCGEEQMNESILRFFCVGEIFDEQVNGLGGWGKEVNGLHAWDGISLGINSFDHFEVRGV